MTPPRTDASRPDLLLERDAERAALDDALARPGRMVVVEGPAGVGKSALLERALEHAREQGALVLSARGTDLESHVAFGVAAQLLGPQVSTDRGLLGGPAAPAATVFGAGDVPGDVAGVVRALAWVLDALTAPRAADGPPVVVAVDDAHWADVASLRLLALVAEHLTEGGLSLVVAIRSGEASGEAGTLLHRLRGHLDARLMRPAPLSGDGVATLVAAAFPGAAPPFVQACTRVTGGNPFLVHALLEALRADAVSPDADGAARVGELVPDTVVRSTLTRLARLPEPAIRLAVAVAILGDDAPLEQAATLAELDGATAEAAADALSWAQLLAPGDPLRFTHPLIAAAVHDDLGDERRSELHRRAARLVSDAGARPDAIAAHLLDCAPAGDPWVVSMLRSAARRALDADEPRTAARFLRRACEEPPPGDTTDIEVELALAEATAGLPGADERLASALELISEPRRRAEAVLQLARLLAARADFSAAAEAAELALDDLDPGDPLAGKLLAVLVDSSSRQTPRRLDALARLEPMVADARSRRFPVDPAMQARLASRMAIGGDADDRATARELAETALLANPLVDEHFHGVPLAWATGALYWIDELEAARNASATALEAAHRRGSTIAAMCALLWLTGSSLQLGAINDAVGAGETSLALAGEGWTALLGWTAPMLALAHLERGDAAAARTALEAAGPVSPDALEHALVLEMRGRIALQDGSPAEAFQAFRAAGAHLRERYRITNPTLSAWCSQAALAASRIGEDAVARKLARAEVEAARRAGNARPLGAALRVAGTVDRTDAGLALLAEAVTVLTASPARLELAKALVDHGIALRETRQLSAARERLREGLELAERCGAATLASAAEQALHGAGGRRRPARSSTAAASLTPAETRIAGLAADGASNREIAAQLYLTTKTVEWHLGNVYTKLGVRSRRDLPRVLTGSGSAAPGA